MSMNGEILIKLLRDPIKGRARQYFPNPSSALVLMPLFLIISSSVYPAIMFSIQNKELAIVPDVSAQLDNKGDGNEIVVDTSGYHSTPRIQETSSSSSSGPASATPAT